jgi:hypothetical protein
MYSVTISKSIQPKNKIAITRPKPGYCQMVRGIIARRPRLCSTQINKPSKMIDKMRSTIIYHVPHPFGASAEYLTSVELKDNT